MAWQVSVYQTACHAMVEELMEGYNATIFAYGQTGAGKRYCVVCTIAPHGPAA